jgi:hypothetical protein
VAPPNRIYVALDGCRRDRLSDPVDRACSTIGMPAVLDLLTAPPWLLTDLMSCVADLIFVDIAGHHQRLSPWQRNALLLLAEGKVHTDPDDAERSVSAASRDALRAHLRAVLRERNLTFGQLASAFGHGVAYLGNLGNADSLGSLALWERIWIALEVPEDEREELRTRWRAARG